MKKLTCGIVIVSNDTLILEGEQYILLGHSTHNIHYDVFKGLQEVNETPLQTAIRELKEETGLCVPSTLLIDLGQHSYNKEKNIHLFLYRTEKSAIDPLSLTCTSMVEQINGQKVIPFPEMDDFKWIPISKLSQYTTSKMTALLLSLAHLL